MRIANYIWENYFTENRIKQRAYQEYVTNHHSRTIYNIIDGAIKQIYSDYIEKKSRRISDFNRKQIYRILDYYKAIDCADYIIFDGIETLLLLPVSKNDEMFHFMEIDNHVFGFKRMRLLAEESMRKKKTHMNIYDIYTEYQIMTGYNTHEMAKREMQIAYNLYFMNPFTKKLYDYAKDHNKKCIAVVKTCYPETFIKKVFKKHNLEFDELYFNSKDLLKLEKDTKTKCAHFVNHSIANQLIRTNSKDSITLPIYDCNIIGRPYRAFMEENFVGSIYSGIINNKIYNTELINKSIYYRYGYVYGGILTLGFCQWLDRLIKDKDIDRVMFFGRDCYIIKEIYCKWFNNANNLYFQTSRMACMPLILYDSFDNYIEAFMASRLDLHMPFGQILSQLGIKDKYDKYNEYFNEQTIISRQNYYEFKRFLYNESDFFKTLYAEDFEAFRTYIDRNIKGSKRILLVDLGWRGSTIFTLKKYIEDNYNANVYGAMMGAFDSDEIEPFFADGSCECFLFSPNEKTYLYKIGKQDFPYGNFCKMFECMYTSSENSVLKYEFDNDGNVIFVREKSSNDLDKEKQLTSRRV